MGSIGIILPSSGLEFIQFVFDNYSYSLRQIRNNMSMSVQNIPISGGSVAADMQDVSLVEEEPIPASAMKDLLLWFARTPIDEVSPRSTTDSVKIWCVSSTPVFHLYSTHTLF